MDIQLKKADEIVYDCPEYISQKENIQLQHFVHRLNREPNMAEVEKTPDGKAVSLPISFIEMTLDELYFGMWELSDVTYQQIFNEVVGTGVLTVKHPVTGEKIRRVGFASVVITQDSGANIQDFNSTKKKNALDLSFPKLKAEILKNAAQSLGKIFGRDLNRKKKDQFNPSLKPINDDAMLAAVKRIEAGETGIIEIVTSHFIVTDEQVSVLSNVKPIKILTNGRA